MVLEIRKRFRVKAGHTGTIDRNGSGLLLLTLNKATRFTRFFQNLDKDYTFTALLGKSTTTYDREGEITSESDQVVTRAELEDALSHFRGPLRQIPPLYSAKHIAGKRAYQYALEGQSVSLPSLPITIYHLQLLEFNFPKFSCHARCSSGTYIRSLVHDLGQRLGCGAHVEEIQRTHIGVFSLEQAHALETVLDPSPHNALSTYLLSLDNALSFLPSFKVSSKEDVLFTSGQLIPLYNETLVQALKNPTDPLRIVTGDERFLGLGVLKHYLNRTWIKPELVYQP